MSGTACPKPVPREKPEKTGRAWNSTLPAARSVLRRAPFRAVRVSLDAGKLSRASQRIAPRSKKRAVEEREYSRLRPGFLAEHDRCAVCGRRSEQVHHRAGRVGALLLYVPLWLAVCGSCHSKITTEPAWAYAAGWSVKRINQRGDAA